MLVYVVHPHRMILAIMTLLVLMTLPLTVSRCHLTVAGDGADPCTEPVVYSLLAQTEHFGITAVLLPTAVSFLSSSLFTAFTFIFLRQLQPLTHPTNTPPPREPLAFSC